MIVEVYLYREARKYRDTGAALLRSAKESLCLAQSVGRREKIAIVIMCVPGGLLPREVAKQCTHGVTKLVSRYDQM